MTNNKLFSEILAQLRDIDTYILTNSILCSGSSENDIEYTPDGAFRYVNFGETDEYYGSPFSSIKIRSSSYLMKTYLNPRAQFYRLITGNIDSNKDLLDLFATLECGNNRKKRLAELNRAKEIIYQLEGSSLDSETLRTIIKQMWPNFGYYATVGLDCTDVKVLKSYDIEEIQSIVNSSKKNGIEISKEIKNILNNQELAHSNGRVLSLARHINKISK